MVSALSVIALLVWTVYRARQPGPWQRVLATREGMIGGMTSSRTIIRPDSRFVALPHPRALGRMVEVRYRDRAIVVPVLDVGSWNVDYGDPGSATPARRPSAGAAPTARQSTPRGSIYPTPVFAELGLPDNDVVEWRFVRRGYTVLPRL